MSVTTATSSAPTIIEVADRILADIHRRGLRPGDAYLGTAETAQWLHVGGSTVNRALQLLAQRGVVRRRQRQGTVIANLQADSAAGALRRVHIIVPEDQLRLEGLWVDGVLLGLQGSLPGVELQFNFRPLLDESEYVQALIRDVLRSQQTAGFVLIRSTVVTQRLVAASGLPAVISGTPQPSIRTLPSVDRDQRQIGILLAEHLLKQRCRRFAIFMRERLTAGDHAMLDGALATLAVAGVGLDALALRCLPTDAAAIQAAASELLSGNSLGRKRGRCGVLCRSEPLACGVDQAAAELELSARQRPAIVVADVAHRQSDDARYPCIEPTIAPSDWGAALGQALAATASGRRLDPLHRTIPVRLWSPPPRDH
jgi:DNA-binding LacI/PurR family transcriptional regulator/DNA-binding transcriptional regulator YhcF (GntR family)